LIRLNLRKQREKEDDEKGKRLKDVEASRKRKHELEKKNEEVRLANKQRTYQQQSKLKVQNWMQGEVLPVKQDHVPQGSHYQSGESELAK